MNTDKILSVSAVIIAVIALVVAIWQGIVVREHNQLSVRPNVLIAPILEGVDGKNGIYISNAGLGPGIVENATLRLNNIDFDLTKNSWPAALENIGVEPICFSHSWLPVGSVIKASEEIALIEVTRSDLASVCYLKIIKLVTNDSISIKITYKSMYNETFTLLKEKLLDKNDINYSDMLIENNLTRP